MLRKILYSHKLYSLFSNNNSYRNSQRKFFLIVGYTNLYIHYIVHRSTPQEKAMLRNTSNLSYDIPTDIKDQQIKEINRLDEAAGSDLVGYLHENEVGKDQSFRGPFGGRKIGVKVMLFLRLKRLFVLFICFFMNFNYPRFIESGKFLLFK